MCKHNVKQCICGTCKFRTDMNVCGACELCRADSLHIVICPGPGSGNCCVYTPDRKEMNNERDA